MRGEGVGGGGGGERDEKRNGKEEGAHGWWKCACPSARRNSLAQCTHVSLSPSIRTLFDFQIMYINETVCAVFC